MPRTSPMLIAILLATMTVAFLPTASAGCANRVTTYGGVVGDTDAFVTDTANSACRPDLGPDTYSDSTCVYLWGVDCAGIPGQVTGIVQYECEWLTGDECL